MAMASGDAGCALEDFPDVRKKRKTTKTHASARSVNDARSTDASAATVPLAWQGYAQPPSNHRRPCDYMCGRYDDMPDPVFPSVCTRWFYPRTSDGMSAGNGCYYCHRLWRNDHSHLKEKDETKREMKRGKRKLDQFHADVDSYIEKMKANPTQRVKCDDDKPKQRLGTGGRC